MAFIRNLYRKALYHELGVVGDQIVEVQDQLEALVERFNRLQAKIGMRELRTGKQPPPSEAPPRDLDAVLRAAAAARGGARANTDGWPETEH